MFKQKAVAMKAAGEGQWHMEGGAWESDKVVDALECRMTSSGVHTPGVM